MTVQQYSLIENDWVNLSSIINDLSQRVVGQEIHPTSSPTFAGLTLTDLTASRLVASDAIKGLESVADLTSWIAGTTNQVAVADDSDGTVTLSTPQDTHTAATPEFAGLVFTNGAFSLTPSTADTDIVITFAGTTNSGILSWMEDEDYFKSSDDIGLDNFKELRFYDDGGNYVGFEAPALTANQIWVLPSVDGSDGDVLSTNGSGTLSWSSNASEKTWTFTSPSGSSGTFYFGGYYDFAASDNDFNPATTHGTANSSYAAHFFIVCAAGGAGGTDTVIRVTGTSINDSGVRTAADTEDLTADDAGAAGAYYETTKKWIGQVSIAKQSGPDLLCNYGFCKYWDNNNSAFTVAGIEATWLGGANDATPDIKLRHHKTTGWTYNAASTPTPPTPIAAMATDHNTEIQVVNGENGAWKRSNLATVIDGSSSEGTIIEVVTTANKTFELGNVLLRITP